MKITSKLSPPTPDFHLLYTLRTRDGREIEYESGPALTMHDRYRECGGCAWCIGEVGFENLTSKHWQRWGSSRPKFYRWPCEPCDACKPKLARLDEIEAEIRRLQDEMRTLE